MSDFGKGIFGCGGGVYVYGITVLNMEVAGNSGVGRVKGFGGGVRGERNGWHQDDHR